MFEKAIEKLKTERAKLTKGAKEINAKYKNEIRPIDTAIQKFEEGIVALGSKDLVSRKSATQEIENILAEFGAIHARVVTEKLHRCGYSMVLQSCPVLFK